MKEAEELEADFLRMVAESLPGIPVVCMWPFWEGAEGPVRLEKIWTVIDKLKYSATLPPYAESASQKRLSLLYRRPDQVVGREIVMLRPPKALERLSRSQGASLSRCFSSGTPRRYFSAHCHARMIRGS